MNFTEGNRIELLKNGDAFFPALISAIDSATTDVRVEIYIFEDDEIGIAIAHALSRAAQRGVRVQVLVDGFGSRHVSAQFFETMRRAGVAVLFFRPERGLFQFRKSRLRRVHRTIVLIDGRVGFVGGINFIDDFNRSLSSTHPRYDYAVKVEGPVLADIYDSVCRLWRVVRWAGLRRSRSESRPPVLDLSVKGGAALAFVARDNFRHRRDIERAYLAAITQAKKEVLIVSPYFLPGRRFRAALRHAARRGVTVTLLLQGPADHPLLKWATMTLYPRLLAVGVVIHEYRVAMLHGKVAVVDRAWATVGSSNLDPFSLLLNREANIVARNATFAETLHQSVSDEITSNATRVPQDFANRRSVIERVKSWGAFMLARLMAGLVGVRTD